LSPGTIEIDAEDLFWIRYCRIMAKLAVGVINLVACHSRFDEAKRDRVLVRFQRRQDRVANTEIGDTAVHREAIARATIGRKRNELHPASARGITSVTCSSHPRTPCLFRQVRPALSSS
jgi:hypothetical protein